MRLRHVLALVSIVAVIGGCIWFFVNGTSGDAVGAGGLPLIKADTRPIKIAPEEPGGEVLPNADSTVFSAMGADTLHDPSMENLKMPGTTTTATENVPDFAGLKTGFALPAEPPKKTENLFGPTPSKTTSDYVSGLAPEALVTPQASEPVAEEAPVDVKKTEAAPAPTPAPTPAPEPEIKKAENTPVPAAVPAEPVIPAGDVKEDVLEDASNPAQAMEAQEKAIITPPVKPVVPSKPIVPAQAAKEKSPEPVKPQTAGTEIPAPMPVQDGEKTVASTSGKPGYYMQLASTPSQIEAPKLWAKLQSRYPDALGGLRPVYQTATVPGKGEYIRVQAGPLTQEQATARCQKLRAVDTKGGCLVLKR